MSPKRKKSTLLELIGTGLAAGLLAVGGGSGIAALVAAARGPELAPQPCTKYWAEIRDLKSAGFTGFSLMSTEAEVAQRCGAASDVAQSWDTSSPAKGQSAP